jgi:GYF domain 2
MRTTILKAIPAVVTLLALFHAFIGPSYAGEQLRGPELAQVMPGMGGLNRGPANPTERPPSGRQDTTPLPGTSAGQPRVQQQPGNEPRIYQVQREDGNQGPFPRSIIEKAVRDGRIVADDLLWVLGSKEWKRADQFPEFRPLFADGKPGSSQEGSSAGSQSSASRGFMIGTWQIAVASPSGGQNRTTMQYRADGSVTGSWEAQSPNGVQSGNIRGRWRAEDIDTQRFTLTVELDGRSAPSVSTLRRVDQNTVFNETANATARRTGS